MSLRSFSTRKQEPSPGLLCLEELLLNQGPLRVPKQLIQKFVAVSSSNPSLRRLIWLEVLCKGLCQHFSSFLCGLNLRQGDLKSPKHHILSSQLLRLMVRGPRQAIQCDSCYGI